MKTVLITGGAGFIGSNFLHYLYRSYPEYRFIVLDLLTHPGSAENVFVQAHGCDKRLQFCYGDVRNAALVRSLVVQADVVVHFAAGTFGTRSIYDNYQFFETDVLGTQVVANAILQNRDQVERFIHISTSEVYGSAVTPKMTEAHPLLPMSPYASSKAAADRLVYSYWAAYGLPAVIIRPFSNYGPCQPLEKLIPRFITSCLLDEPLTVHGDGSQLSDWVFVEDTCRAIDRAVHCDLDSVIGQAINIGSGEDRSVLDIAQLVLKMMGKSEKLISYGSDRPGQVSRHTADSQMAKELLGWTPSVTFQEGINRTIDWYKANVSWWWKELWMRDQPSPKILRKPIQFAG